MTRPAVTYIFLKSVISISHEKLMLPYGNHYSLSQSHRRPPAFRYQLSLDKQKTLAYTSCG